MKLVLIFLLAGIFLFAWLLIFPEGSNQSSFQPSSFRQNSNLLASNIYQQQSSAPVFEPVKPYPVKTAVYWTHPLLYDVDLPRLAKHDIAIIDLENMFNNRERLVALKALNPQLKLLAYSNPMEIFNTVHQSRPWQRQIIKEITQRRQAWILKTIAMNQDGSLSQNYARFYPGMTMLNMSSSCPKIAGETYTQWIAGKVREEILADPIWDGYFMDNGTSNIAWTNYQDSQSKKIDINGNLKPDRDAYVDHKWAEGVNQYLNLLTSEPQTLNQRLLSFFGKNKKEKKRDLIIISNKGDLFLRDRVQGKFFEKFPNDYLGDKWAGGWLQCLKNAEQTGVYTIFNASHVNEAMFVLASALLLDNVYVSIAQDNAGYFPEFEVDLGRPLEKYRESDGIYTRRYQWGTVKVNPLARTGEILR